VPDELAFSFTSLTWSLTRPTTSGSSTLISVSFCEIDGLA
jgi:hypothetical protein